MSKYLLLQTAAPDALIRLKSTQLSNQWKDLWRVYHEDQCHSFLEDFLKRQLMEHDAQGGLLMQVHGVYE